MKCEHLLHKFGGRILDLSSIEHDTDKNGSYWQFRGHVKWNDGGESETAISPVHFVFDGDPGRAELDTSLVALNDYLARNGEWDKCGTWKPRARRGSEPLQ